MIAQTQILEQVVALTRVRKTTPSGLTVPYQAFIEQADWIAEGDVDAAKWDCIRWLYLAKHLSELEKAAPKILTVLQKRFRRAEGNTLQFDGVRAEAYVAASLVRSGIPFSMGESPDFQISDLNLQIEVTSCRLEKQNSDGDVYYKLSSKITEKCKKRYATDSCVLVMDISPLLHASRTFDTDKLKEHLAPFLQKPKYGAIVAFFTVGNDIGMATERIETLYIRLGPLSATVDAFMNSWLPLDPSKKALTQFVAFKSP